jgi:EAL domain-containing protein (putative c-di-GMP-specific phosphodiesterase class I)
MIGDAVPGAAAPPRPPDEAVRLAIDDFGAGTTSLAHLRQLPISRLKIDRTLIADAGGEDAERAGMVLRTLADLAGNLGMEVVAEGVEEPAQRSAVISCGIRLAQGFLFGRPAPVLERAS